MDGQLALGIGLIVLSLSIPITALIVLAMPRRESARVQDAVLVDQDRVRGVQLMAKGQAENLAGMQVHLGNIDGRLDRIEKKIYE